MALDATQISFTEYNIAYANEDIGYVKMGQTMTQLGFKYIQVNDTAQTVGIVAISKQGVAPTLKVEMFQTKFESIFGSLAGDQVYPIVDGAKQAWGVGDRKVDLFDLAETAVLHPVGVNSTDLSQDIMYWKAVPDLSSVQYGGNRDNAQTVTMNFFILRDSTKSDDFNYGLFGDWSATTNAAPNSVYITTESKARAPYKHTTALTLSSEARTQVYAYGFYRTSSTVTAAINEAGDITATTATFNFDTLSSASNLAVDDYILCGTEVMQIYAITYATSTTGSISVYRGLGGSTAAAHLDNAVLTKLASVYVIPVTRRATWASSAGDDVTVGDTSSTKGLLTWVADGSDTITATVSSVASPNLTVTATT